MLTIIMVRQNRGSPHVHALIWSKLADVLGDDGIERFMNGDEIANLMAQDTEEAQERLEALLERYISAQ
jgi:hypothetical protein